MLGRRVLDYLVYLAVRVLICAVQSLPLDTCDRISRLLAALFGDVLKFRHDVIEENLRHAFPDWSAEERKHLERRMWEHLFLLAVEVAHAPRKIHETNWRDHVTLGDQALVVRALLDDRPTIIVSAHYGNFELSGYMLGILGFTTYTIARPLDNPYLDKYLKQVRWVKGQRILPKQGSAPQIEKLLQEKGSLALLADQYGGPKGCWVEFFGRPASAHKAIALFSMSNDAPLVICCNRRLGKPLQHFLSTEAVADPRSGSPEFGSVTALTQWYTSHLERVIRRAPEQYWWMHRRWKDTRPKKAPKQNRAA